MRDTEILGRVYLQTEYERSQAILSKFRRMAKDPKYVELLFNDVQTMYPEETDKGRMDIFIGLTYRVYSPLSFLQRTQDGKACGKLPEGVRDEMARLLGFVSSEMINHHKNFIDPWLKPYNNGVERPLMTKVMALVDRFKPYSINASDSQFKLEM